MILRVMKLVVIVNQYMTLRRAWKSKGNSGNSWGNPTLSEPVRPLFNVSSATLSSIVIEKYYHHYPVINCH